MKKLKVMTIVGTRPEIIRLSRVIPKLDEHCHHVLVHTGQNYDYELNQIFFQELGIKRPNYFLNAAGNSSAETIGNVIISVDRVLSETQPEAILLLGDTNSCMAVLPAKRRKIPIFHMEAGNRCFDMRVPEEINRRIVDHTADINLTYSTIARDYLLAEGLQPDHIIKIGSPMYEVLNFYLSKINASNILKELRLNSQNYFVVSAHREEHIECQKSFLKLAKVLNMLAETYGLPVIVSTHPRTQKRINISNVKFHPLVNLMKPLGFFSYVKLQIHSRSVLSDSGTINEEASILNLSALNLREVHERPEGMEEAAVMMVGLNLERIIQGLGILATQGRDKKRSVRLVDEYSVSNVSEKVVRILHSYTDYVNRSIWKKYP